MKKLSEYNHKRNFNNTKEPIGKERRKNSKKLSFVVQHHKARKDHYDFRLEYDGVLKSFAIPKGPSYNHKDKRLAVQVEDHPYSYRNFEGVIPQGEYGGGTVMLWDCGYYEIIEDTTHGFKNGAIKFILYGKRLKGRWTLVYFKEDNWLLIKEKDNIKGFKDINEYDTSIKTGRTMAEIGKGISKQGKIKLTNPGKIIYQHPKITKQDIFNYYEKVSERMLPFVERRILSTIRCPQGKSGECFFKKHFESNKSLGRIKIPSQNEVKTDYYYIKDQTGILEEVQMNGYEFHVWGSLVNHLNHPDMLVFDLDPDEGMDIRKIRQGVKDLKSILDELHLTSFLKTSGGKGYHVVVPIHQIKTWTKFREVAKNIAQLMVEKWPDRYVANVRKNKRDGKIFIDWIRNTKGATSVAPYSLRIKKKAAVSMPIKWSELDKVRPDEITMEDAIKRLKRKDPWENFFLLDQ